MSTMDKLIEGREDAKRALEYSTMTASQKSRIEKIADMTNTDLDTYCKELEAWRSDIKEEAKRRKTNAQ